jgi:hypothetical protein
MRDPKIHVTARFSGVDQPLLRVFEAGVDLDMVVVEHTPQSVKAITPLCILISAATVLHLKTFILEPLINPITEKYNWKRAVYWHFLSHQPFSLSIRLENEGLLIELSDIYNSSVTANIWDTISKTLCILLSEGFIGKITKISLYSRNADTVTVCCYQNEQPVCLVDIDEGRTIFISEVTEIPPSDAELSNEDWLIKEFARAAQYEQAIMQYNKAQSDSSAK